VDNLDALNAMLYAAEDGCEWRGLPGRFGNWHTSYTRMSRWLENGGPDRGFAELQRRRIVNVPLEAVGMDSAIARARPDGTGASKKSVGPSENPAAGGPPKFIGSPRMNARP